MKGNDEPRHLMQTLLQTFDQIAIFDTHEHLIAQPITSSSSQTTCAVRRQRIHPIRPAAPDVYIRISMHSLFNTLDIATRWAFVAAYWHHVEPRATARQFDALPRSCTGLLISTLPRSSASNAPGTLQLRRWEYCSLTLANPQESRSTCSPGTYRRLPRDLPSASMDTRR